MLQPLFKGRFYSVHLQRDPDALRSFPGGLYIKEGGRLSTDYCFICNCLEEAWLQLGRDHCEMYSSSESTVDLGRTGLFSNNIALLLGDFGEVHCLL